MNVTLNWQLQEDAQLYETIYKRSPLCIAFSDPKGNIIRVNRLYCEVTGYSEAELIGKNYADFTPPEEMEKEIAAVRGAIESSEDYYRWEKSIYHKNGDLIWLDMAISVVRNEQDGIKYILAMGNEITDRVKMRSTLKEREQELKEQNDLLEKMVSERTEELDEKNRSLEKSNQDLEAFAYAASHDLKEPIRTIGSFTKLFLRRYKDKIDQAGIEQLEFIFDATIRMNNLINNILNFSSTTGTSISFNVVNINSVLDNKVKDLHQLIQNSNAKIIYSNLPEQVLCDEDRISVVFHNLISNALKFQDKKDPEVHICCNENPTAWEFCVQDNGIGISQEYQNKIFGLFKRLHSRSEFEGTGIGLNLCQKIIEQHGGRITVESIEGEGSKFIFTIPKGGEASNLN